MFIVSMMITVLAAVGMFALAAAATEVKTAGNERQSAQTHYLSEYGVLAFTRETEQGKVASQISLMKSSPDTCVSLPIPAASYINGSESFLTRECYRFSASQLGGPGFGNWAISATDAYTGPTSYAPGVNQVGSLGPITMNGGFFVEVTDVNTRNVSGYSVGLCQFAVVTGTSFGVTQPLVSNNVAYGAEGMEMQRARIVAGPLCPPPG